VSADSLTFDVVGMPGAQGSKRHVGKGVMVESSKRTAPWRQDVVHCAGRAAKAVGWEPLTGPVEIGVVFRFTRPKAHYRANGDLKPEIPYYITSRAAGDIDKLLRSTFDALTSAGIWVDDSQAVDVQTSKIYAPTAGAHITIRGVRP
jgi:Holliday junction resolvase RusA-like endonuclease